MLCQIIPEKCIACGLCQVKAPNIFDYTDDGIVIFKDSDQLEQIIPEKEQEHCLAAYQKCPTRAIILQKK